MTRPLPLALALALVGCASKPPPQAKCPPCECKCDPAAPDGPVAAGPTTVAGPPTTALNEEIAELYASASRKMNFRDGAGCLADLDRLAVLAPKLTRTSAVYLRGTCEMQIGQCQAGKQRLFDYFRGETNMHPDRANAAVESMAAMYCSGGDSSERDRLLGALQELAIASYSETRTPAQCAATIRTIQELAPRVKPRDVDDHQVANAGKTLYATAPNCYARAGDCAAAWRSFRELWPPENLKDLDAKKREEVLGQTFDAMVQRCKGKR